MIRIKTVFCFSVLAALALFDTGCTTRNLRRGTTSQSFRNAPLERFLTYSSREPDMEAGLDPTECASPVATETTLYFPSETHGLTAMFRYDQRVRWNLPVKNGISSPLVLRNQYLYFGGNDGYFYAVDKNNGSVKWKFETKSPVVGKAALADDGVYFIASDDTLYALDANTGKWLWHYKRSHNFATTVRGNSAPTIDGDRIYAGFSDGYFLSLEKKSGNVRWERKIHNGSKFLDVDAEAVLFETRIYVPSYDGGLYCLERDSGKILWQTDVGGSKRILLDGKSIYLPASNGYIYSLDRDNGKVNWNFELDLGTPTNMIHHGNYLVFGSSRQYIYVIRTGDGSLAFRQNIGLRSGFFGSPTEQGNEIYFVSNFGTLYGFHWL